MTITMPTANMFSTNSKKRHIGRDVCTRIITYRTDRRGIMRPLRRDVFCVLVGDRRHGSQQARGTPERSTLPHGRGEGNPSAWRGWVARRALLQMLLLLLPVLLQLFSGGCSSFFSFFFCCRPVQWWHYVGYSWLRPASAEGNSNSARLCLGYETILTFVRAGFALRSSLNSFSPFRSNV